jgi:signal transduction histidine kinase
MSKTIDDFKNFFKPEKQRAPFHIQSAIEYAKRMVGSRIKHYNIHLDVTGGDVEIVGYQNEFAQVLINLINNARDAFEDNGVRSGGRIGITIKKEDSCTVMEVEDNAGGIPEPIMEKIFDPYFTTKEDDKGTGVGLYMSKMIIEESMNGKLYVANGPEGARFTIVLRHENDA